MAEHNPTGKCQYCWSQIRYRDQFCKVCGKRNDGWELPQKGQCGNCHEELQESDRYCRFCGTKVGKGAYEPYQSFCQLIYGPCPETRFHHCTNLNCGYKWSSFSMLDEERYCPQCGTEAKSDTKFPDFA